MKKSYIISATAIALGIMLSCFVIGRVTAPSEVVEVETVRYVEVVNGSPFDMSIIEDCWCGEFEDGTVRMVGAWHYADGVIEDEQGQLWGIDQQIAEEDFLLLWIADNHTPDYTFDDVVVKVWREAY